MDAKSRTERLAAEHAALCALREASSIFSFESLADPPDRYTLVFRGEGVSQDASAQGEVKREALHRCDLRLPYSFPERPPDLRWLTPIFHPNISFSGLLLLDHIGLAWDRDLSLEVVCERLWDVARLAYVDLQKADNFAAKKWFQSQQTLQLPVDLRPLRDKQAKAGANVIRYQRRGAGQFGISAGGPAADILYIGEDTPTPELPSPRRRADRRGDDDDVIYIGDE